MKQIPLFVIVVILLCGGELLIVAQESTVPSDTSAAPLSGQAMDQLLAPIALYPDPLIAQILSASTFPSQIVLADRYVSGGGNPALIDQQPWDTSVKALARYPSVLKMMDDNLNWTAQLGQVFLNQEHDVMDSIQRLRAMANNLGNLSSTAQQQVVVEDGEIEILPVNPEIIYLPVYQPDEVYYQSSDGVAYITFGIGWPIGGWLDYDCDWGNEGLIFWSHDHPRPSNWWHESYGQRNATRTVAWHAAASHSAGAGGNYEDRGRAVNPSPPVLERAATMGQAPLHNSSNLNTSRPEAVTGYKAPQMVPAANIPRPTPAVVPVQHGAPAYQPEPKGTFIGTQSTHDVNAYSNRGQQSLQTTARSAPAAQPTRSSSGGNSSGSQKKH